MERQVWEWIVAFVSWITGSEARQRFTFWGRASVRVWR